MKKKLCGKRYNKSFSQDLGEKMYALEERNKLPQRSYL